MQNIFVSIVESYIDRKLKLGASSSSKTESKSSKKSSSRSSSKHSHTHPSRRGSAKSNSSSASSAGISRQASMDSINITKRRNGSSSSAASFQPEPRGRTLQYNPSAERSISRSRASDASFSGRRGSSVDSDLAAGRSPRRPSDLACADMIVFAGLPALSSDEPWRPSLDTSCAFAGTRVAVC
ncbi:hypothetical protein PYCC9005_001373 [Savitreella phatthalungensis]